MHPGRLRIACLQAAEAAVSLLARDGRARRRPAYSVRVPSMAGGARHPVAVEAWSAHDVKLAIDRRCEEAILLHLRRRFGRPGMIGEELGVLEGDGDLTWIVDPLDGSVNYLHGLPFFAVSVACARGEARRIAEEGRLPELLAGAVLMPALGLRFAAELGGGAKLNGRPLRLVGRGPLERALVGVSMSVRSAGLALPAAVLERVAASVQKVRALGATAGELALVAAGKLDGMVHHGTHLWDLAAGTLVALEAGAAVDARPQPTFAPHLTLAFDDLDDAGAARLMAAVEWRAHLFPNRLAWICDNVCLHRREGNRWIEHHAWRPELTRS